jgi:hypothetical protein
MKIYFLALFLSSAPIAALAVFNFGQLDNAKYWAIGNSYVFSTGMIGLYIYPFFQSGSFASHLHTATMNWIVWLSVFTELIFQSTHNLFVEQLHKFRGTIFEWPFYSYGLSDARWSNYNDGKGLDPVVWLINWNDFGLGLLVGICFVWYRIEKNSQSSSRRQSSVVLVLVTVFRDATLWRETVEYMWDHHRLDYMHTISDPVLRPHAIACLWTV